MSKRRYMIYDGNTLIGTYTSPEAGEIFGVSRYTVSKYAYSGDRLHGRYIVKYEGDVLKCEEGENNRDKIIRKCDFREGWENEWEGVTAVIREQIEVEKLIQENWDKAVRPFRRQNWMWKEQDESCTDRR